MLTPEQEEEVMRLIAGAEKALALISNPRITTKEMILAHTNSATAFLLLAQTKMQFWDHQKG